MHIDRIVRSLRDNVGANVRNHLDGSASVAEHFLYLPSETGGVLEEDLHSRQPPLEGSGDSLDESCQVQDAPEELTNEANNLGCPCPPLAPCDVRVRRDPFERPDGTRDSPVT